MKKLILFVTLGVFLIGLAACGGGGKYADLKSTVNEMLDATEEFVAACDKDNVDEVIAAMTKYAEKMKALAPKMKELQEKYPEAKDFDKNPPEELKELAARLNEVMPKMMGVFGKLAKYASDPKFIEAQKKLSEAMSGMK